MRKRKYTAYYAIKGANGDWRLAMHAVGAVNFDAAVYEAQDAMLWLPAISDKDIRIVAVTDCAHGEFHARREAR